MRLLLSATAALGLVFSASAASAQDSSDGWTGFYAGGQLGYGWQPGDSNEVVNFDRNLDGNFGDAFVNFQPNAAGNGGMCGGAPTSANARSGCSKDNDSTNWKIHAGYDYGFGFGGGEWVAGAVIEYGKSYLYDNVTAFSTTPAVYKMQAVLKSDGSIRARGGYAFETGTLVYGTVGAAYGKIDNNFSTSNTVNNVTLSKTKKNAWGLVWGGGIDQKIGRFTIGTLYTMTTFKNHDHTVRLGTPFVANPANPFIAQNAAGTDFRRSFSKFAFHSVRAVVSYRF